MINTIVPRWSVTVDGQSVLVAVRRHLLDGPYIQLDGQPVDAEQDPAWGRVPLAPERHYRFQLGNHATEIIEHHYPAGNLAPWIAWYELHLDGQPVEWQPPR